MSIEPLIPYIERELVALRRSLRELCERYPTLAKNLKIDNDGGADPSTERLIQSLAILAARAAKRYDDGFPQLAEGLLETLFPHYLRPFPSCAIAHVEPGHATLPRGTELDTEPIDGIRCRFKTAYDVPATEISLTDARFDPAAKLPTTVRIPTGATAVISLALGSLPIRRPEQTTIRLYIDGEPSFCAVLRDTLFLRCTGAILESHGGEARKLATVPLTGVGFADEDALIPFTARSHAASRILLEYFAFPEKFNFVDLALSDLWAKPEGNGTVATIHFLLRDIRHDSDAARLLASLSKKNLRIGCTPVVNLFKRPGEPIAVTRTAPDYPVSAHPNYAHNFEIYSIDKVYMQHQSGKNASVTEFRPLYALRHAEDPSAGGHYWVLRHDAALGRSHPGSDKRISFVDSSFNPAVVGKTSVSLSLTCTNRDLPLRIKDTGVGGSLQPIAGTSRAPIRFIRRPSPSYRFRVDAGLHWRLISHLTLNHRSLTNDGASGFQEMLLLYDVTQSAATQRQISGVVGFEHRDAATWIKSKYGASLVHGTEVRITVDEDAFVGRSIHLFAQVLDHFLAMYAQLNSFIELVIVSQQSREEIIRCKPRTGKKALL
ncbi:type VI secretion system baseplate subunit TssF [Pseudoduganella sp. GCM10020061]|uniref:type VI secretion system baseplate subunit TssF n=1 Tax=Pseudoduganella sp. GCM10020061 TaxID=3317345 RepID=UPI00363F383F